MKFYADAIKFVLVLSLIGRSHNLSIWSISFFVFVLVLTCIHAIYGTIFNHSLLLIAHSLTCVHTHATVQDITHMHLSLSLSLSLSPSISLSCWRVHLHYHNPPSETLPGEGDYPSCVRCDYHHRSPGPPRCTHRGHCLCSQQTTQAEDLLHQSSEVSNEGSRSRKGTCSIQIEIHP